MSAYIPVAPDRWAEMVQAWAEVGPLRNKVGDLSTQLELRQVEIDRLRAEVERLKQPWVKILTESETWNALSEVARLTAENERLRKAGDAMADEMGLETYADEHFEKQEKLKDAWNAAKEGRDAK